MTKHLLDLDPADLEHRRWLVTELVALRRYRDLNQGEVAAVMGCTGGAVSAFERQPVRGKRQPYNPTVPVLQSYSRAIGYPITFHIGDSEWCDEAAVFADLAAKAARPTTSDDYIRQAVIAQLRHVRVGAGISQVELGRRMGCTSKAAQQIEDGHAEAPRLSTWQRYARAADTTLTVQINTYVAEEAAA